MPGNVIYMKTILRSYVQEHPEMVFVFGDNMLRYGLGGQAGAMRDEPNTVGIPTKWAPNSSSSAFFKDEEFHIVKKAVDFEIDQLKAKIAEGYIIVIPEDGIGTGFANLAVRAPKIFEYIRTELRKLEEL